MLKASINLIKNLKKQKRENCSLLFLDNIKIIKDALNAGLKAKYLLIENEELNIFENNNIEEIFLTDKKSIEQLADTKTPQGVVCIIEYTQHKVEKPTSNFLVLDGMQDPGNVGTLIRTAKASGFNSIFLVDSVKINNTKLIRSSVGAIFNINIYSISREEFINNEKQWNFDLLKADMNGENIFNAKFNNIIGLVIGNEGNGVSKDISAICNKSVKIPMKQGIESLNAAISGSIIMYQINKDSF